mmetsp:Transcript_10175/g.33674  ORF Transcript_10175/g.33674 Transcript_10175/m.33674 type:complete len:216 (+) Transcript_10175:736-1383(+)
MIFSPGSSQTLTSSSPPRSSARISKRRSRTCPRSSRGTSSCRRWSRRGSTGRRDTIFFLGNPWSQTSSRTTPQQRKRSTQTCRPTLRRACRPSWTAAAATPTSARCQGSRTRPPRGPRPRRSPGPRRLRRRVTNTLNLRRHDIFNFLGGGGARELDCGSLPFLAGRRVCTKGLKLCRWHGREQRAAPLGPHVLRGQEREGVEETDERPREYGQHV